MLEGVAQAPNTVSGQLRLAYLAPEVLKRVVFGGEVTAVTVMQVSDCAAMVSEDQADVEFGFEYDPAPV